MSKQENMDHSHERVVYSVDEIRIMLNHAISIQSGIG